MAFCGYIAAQCYMTKIALFTSFVVRHIELCFVRFLSFVLCCDSFATNMCFVLTSGLE